MKSLEKLTVDVLDAALEGFAFDELNPDRTALSEDGKQEIGIMDKLYSESLQLQGTFLAFEDLINNKYERGVFRSGKDTGHLQDGIHCGLECARCNRRISRTKETF